MVERESELEAAIAVRFRVFVAEQSVPPEEELDDADATATHVIAVYQRRVVGPGRLIPLGDGCAQLGRMAVDADWRGNGIGSQILKFLEQTARDLGMSHSVIHAQEYLTGFYASRGYLKHGAAFLEVDIPHIEMRKDL